MPAATDLAPSRTIEAARTVAVVVPSPAMSFVFDARTKRDLDGIGENIDASQHSFARIGREFYFFRSHCLRLLISGFLMD
jgi:hypothetical protein